MISVDNFYWVLYQNLLAPVGLDCWYYHPWGTKQNLSRYEFKTWDRMSDNHHVLFHFDQEPIWHLDLGTGYDQSCETEWSHGRFAKVLANSERSSLKQQLCQNRDMLDWYFFYHAFAALDWFRDAEHIVQDRTVQNAFLSFNLICQDHRSYRMSLMSRLLEQDIVHHGTVSMHIDAESVQRELENPSTRLSLHSSNLIRRHLTMPGSLPWRIDNVSVDGNLSARFGHHELALWQKSLLHVVNETVFYEAKLHLTEKTFKPIVAQRPFVLVAAPGNLAYLRSYGFQTFGTWIDESYDSILDADQRLDAIAREVAKIAKLSQLGLRNLHQDMHSVLQHNRNHFFGDFRRHIVKELVDNFDQCVRSWNHARLDGHVLTAHPDLAMAEHALLI